MNEVNSKMMVSGQIHVAGTKLEVRRCMPVLSCDGCKLGMVAAVCFDSQTQEVGAVLLGSFPVSAGYRLIPISLIDRVGEGCLYLFITAESAAKLEPHQAE